MASKKNTTALPADQQCAQQRTLDKHTRVVNIFISTRSNNGYSHNPWLVIKTCSFEHVFV